MSYFSESCRELRQFLDNKDLFVMTSLKTPHRYSQCSFTTKKRE